MGQNTDAILFWGVLLDDEAPAVAKEDLDDWVDVELERRGHVDPWKSFPHGAAELNRKISYDEERAFTATWMNDNHDALDSWYALKKQVQAEFGCKIDTHCSSGYPMYYVAIAESEIVANRGYPEEIKPTTLKWKPEWEQKLGTFVATFDIDVGDANPKWWLASNWSY